MGRNKALNRMRKQGIKNSDMLDLGNGRVAVYVAHDMPPEAMDNIPFGHTKPTGAPQCADKRAELRKKMRLKLRQKQDLRKTHMSAGCYNTGEQIATCDSQDFMTRQELKRKALPLSAGSVVVEKIQSREITTELWADEQGMLREGDMPKILKSAIDKFHNVNQ